MVVMRVMWCSYTDSLVVYVFPLTVDLIDQGEVEVETFHPLSVKHSHLGLILLKLHVLYHVREPDTQTMIADNT